MTAATRHLTDIAREIVKAEKALEYHGTCAGMINDHGQFTDLALLEVAVLLGRASDALGTIIATRKVAA